MITQLTFGKLFALPAADGTYKKIVTLNLGRRRTVREDVPRFHISIKHRMETLGYKINNDVSEQAVIEWVV